MKSAKRTLICVDDEEQILRALKRCLRSENFDLLTTTDPSQVVSWITEGAAQVVISDFRMNQITGIELFKKISKVDDRVVRVILSGYADQDTVNQALQNGLVYNYLLKPWEAEVLKVKIQEYFEHYELEAAKNPKGDRI